MYYGKTRLDQQRSQPTSKETVGFLIHLTVLSETKSISTNKPWIYQFRMTVMNDKNISSFWSSKLYCFAGALESKLTRVNTGRTFAEFSQVISLRRQWTADRMVNEVQSCCFLCCFCLKFRLWSVYSLNLLGRVAWRGSTTHWSLMYLPQSPMDA